MGCLYTILLLLPIENEKTPNLQPRYKFLAYSELGQAQRAHSKLI